MSLIVAFGDGRDGAGQQADFAADLLNGFGTSRIGLIDHAVEARLDIRISRRYPAAWKR